MSLDSAEARSAERPGLGEEASDVRFAVPIVRRLEELIQRTQALVTTLAEQAEADRRAFEQAYALGFAAGTDVGRESERRDQEQAGAVLWKAVQRSAPDGPSHAELEKIRYPGYTPERLRELREAARERLGLPPRSPRACPRCQEPNQHFSWCQEKMTGRGVLPGGTA